MTVQKRYQSETHRGYKIEFVKEYGNPLIWGRPVKSKRWNSNQYMGSGKTKAEAFRDVKSSMDLIIRANPKKYKID